VAKILYIPGVLLALVVILVVALLVLANEVGHKLTGRWLFGEPDDGCSICDDETR